ELVTELGGPPHTYVVCDVSDPASVRKMAERVSELSPRVDILVNNAGISTQGSFLEGTPEGWEKVIRTNLLGAMWCSKELLPVLRAAARKGKTPVVVNVASMAGRIPTPRSPDYAASKHGLVAFSEAIWEELSTIHIRSMVVNPGFTQTDGFPMGRLLRNTSTSWAVMGPKRVVSAMIRGIERGSFEVRVQWWMHPLYHAAVLGGPLRRVIAASLRKKMRGFGPL
ncbi:MAG: SDR family NAD(P)-dependent oxidoreductase, partial [Actinomycetota bacterium]